MQVALDLRRERVELLVAVETDDRDGAVALDPHEAQRSTSLISRRGRERLPADVVEALPWEPVLGAPHADDRDRAPLLRQHRRRGTEERLLELADAGRPAGSPYLGELGLQASCGRSRSSRVKRSSLSGQGRLALLR